MGLRPELKQAFAALSSSERTLAANLDKIGARNERSALWGAVEAFAAIRALLGGDVGIIAKVRRNIEMKEKCERMSASLMDIAAKQAQRGKKSVSAAQGEQENSIRSLNHSVGFTRNLILVIGILAIVLGIGFGVWIYRSVTKPLSELAGVAEQVERTGDLSLRGKVATHDEVGLTVKAFNSLLKTIHKIIADINQVMTAMAANDLTLSVHAVSEANRFEAEMARIATAAVEIEQMLQLIATAIEEQNSTVAVINENVNTLNDIAVQNATASEQMSLNMAELTRIADETGDRVAHFRL